MFSVLVFNAKSLPQTTTEVVYLISQIEKHMLFMLWYSIFGINIISNTITTTASGATAPAPTPPAH